MKKQTKLNRKIRGSIEEQGNNQDIVTIPTEAEDLTFTEISEDNETNLSNVDKLSNVNKENEFEEDIAENFTDNVEEESDDYSDDNLIDPK